MACERPEQSAEPAKPHLRLVPPLSERTADTPEAERDRQTMLRGLRLFGEGYFGPGWDSWARAMRWVGRRQKRDQWQVIRGGRA
jgi:hypothetical protein